MNWTDLLSAIELCAVCLGIAIAYSLVIVIAGKIAMIFVPKTSFDLPQIGAIALLFAVLASVVGLLTGASRSPVVSSVVPASLSLIGGVALLAVTREKADTLSAALAVVSFSLFLLFGTALGVAQRRWADATSFSNLHNIDTQFYLADVEQAINAYRVSLGLQPIDYAAR